MNKIVFINDILVVYSIHLRQNLNGCTNKTINYIIIVCEYG